MNKRKIEAVTILFEGGEDKFCSGLIEGTFSECTNARKKSGFKNLQEWTEYHVTWVVYHKEPVEEIVEVNQEDRLAAEELMKHPGFAGIADGRAFYKQEPQKFDFDPFIDIREGYSNGST